MFLTIEQEMEPSAFNQTKYGGNMFYFRIKLDTENASRLRVERRGAQQVAGKRTGCNLCALAHEGRFQFFGFEGIMFYKGGCFFLMQCNGDKKISPRLTSLMLIGT